MKKIIYTIMVLIISISCTNTNTTNKLVKLDNDDIQYINISNNNLEYNKDKETPKTELEQLVEYIDNNNTFNKRNDVDSSIAEITVDNVTIKLLYCTNNPIKIGKLLKAIDNVDTKNVIALMVYNKNSNFMCNNTNYQYDVLYLNNDMEVISKGLENHKTHCSTKLCNIALYIPKGIIPKNKIQLNDKINLPNVYNMNIYNFKGV